MDNNVCVTTETVDLVTIAQKTAEKHDGEELEMKSNEVNDVTGRSTFQAS